MDPLTTAQIAWGFLADPGDPLARALCEAWGPEKALGLVTGSGTSAAVFAGLGRASHPLDGSHLRHWRARYHPDEVARSYHLQQRAGIEVLDSSHRAWPTTMNDLGPSAPLSLWVRGNPTIWAAHPVSLAVVGSRRPTGAGLGHTTSIVQGAWCDTVAIVSGGATGIDTVAHHAALVHDRVPLVVLAGGLDAVYPAENVALMNRIAERGALYSEAPCGMRVKPEKFLARNRLIAALANAVVVVEAAHRSGAINTAYHAAGLGREVGVVPGRWEDRHAKGCFRLARDLGARILTEAEDVRLLLPGLQEVHA